MKVGANSILDHVVNTLEKQFDKNSISIATTDNANDDIVEEYCKSRSLHFFRGSEQNVASRFKEILELFPECSTFFRVCADGPLISTDTMLDSLQLIQRNSFVTSMPNKGFPMGMNIELFNKDLFLNSYPLFHAPAHFEHVTRYFYESITQYEVGLMKTSIDNFHYDRLKFSVDTQEDLRFMTAIFSEFPDINQKSANEKILCAMSFLSRPSTR